MSEENIQPSKGYCEKRSLLFVFFIFEGKTFLGHGCLVTASVFELYRLLRLG